MSLVDLRGNDLALADLGQLLFSRRSLKLERGSLLQTEGIRTPPVKHTPGVEPKK